MFDSGAFNYINVLDKAADASWIRNEAIANNIANVDTPGYKRKDISFNTFLLRSSEPSSNPKAFAPIYFNVEGNTIFSNG